MKRFEYKIVEYAEYNFNSGWLNYEGSDGWELVSVVLAYQSSIFKCCFKREIPQQIVLNPN